MHPVPVYEIHPRKDHRGVNLISMRCHSVACGLASRKAISNAIGYAKFFSRSHDAVIHVCDAVST